MKRIVTQRRRQNPPKPLKRPTLTNYPVTASILIICILMECITSQWPDSINYLGFSGSTPWGLLTHLFTHGSWDHLIGNFLFGLSSMLYIEHRFKGTSLLRWFLLCGGASAMTFGLMMGFGHCMIGSSGAIFGIMCMASVSFGRTWLERALCCGFLSALLVPQIMDAIAYSQMSNVAMWGHVGGGLAGILFGLEKLRK